MDTAARPNPNRIVKLTDAGALIAAIPSLMGFHPANSFLVVTLLKGGLVGTTVRVDLPPPELHAAVVGRVLRPVRQAHAETAVVLVVCADPGPGHVDLVRQTVAGITDAGMPVLHALWTPAAVGGAPWHCYLHDDCEGEVPDPTSTECAAAMALAGLVTFESREDLVMLFEPPDPERMIRLSGVLDVTSKADRTPSVTHLSVVRAAVESGALPCTDEEFVRLAMALSDYRVRDACLGFILDATVAPVAEKLWLELARCLPPPERAEAAALLAVSAYLRGDGAMANVALEQARASLPDHSLAGLLQGAVDYGFPVAQMRQALVDAAADAHLDIAEASSDMPAEPVDAAEETTAAVDEADSLAGESGDAAGKPGRMARESAGTRGEPADMADAPSGVAERPADRTAKRDDISEEPDMST